MRYATALSGLMLSLPGLLCAQTEQDVYGQLAEGLRQEVQLLSGISDAGSAQAALPALEQVIRTLAALNEQMDEKQLWRYIDNTPGLKQPLIEEIERLFVQLQRLEKAQFFGSEELHDLLRPMLSSAS